MKYCKIISVRYHCGGWSEEVNSCIFNSYMVYLEFRLLSTFGIIIYTYTGYDIHGAIPLLFSSPCSLFYSPFTYLETLLAVTGSVHSGPRLLITDLPISLPLLIYPSFQVYRRSLWAPQVKEPNPCSSGYISTTHQSFLCCTLSPAIHFNGSNGTAYTRPSKVHNKSPLNDCLQIF